MSDRPGVSTLCVSARLDSQTMRRVNAYTEAHGISRYQFAREAIEEKLNRGRGDQVARLTADRNVPKARGAL